jgi:hypothetical protein
MSNPVVAINTDPNGTPAVTTTAAANGNGTPGQGGTPAAMENQTQILVPTERLAAVQAFLTQLQQQADDANRPVEIEPSRSPHLPAGIYTDPEMNWKICLAIMAHTRGWREGAGPANAQLIVRITHGLLKGFGRGVRFFDFVNHFKRRDVYDQLKQAYANFTDEERAMINEGTGTSIFNQTLKAYLVCAGFFHGAHELVMAQYKLGNFPTICERTKLRIQCSSSLYLAGGISYVNRVTGDPPVLSETVAKHAVSMRELSDYAPFAIGVNGILAGEDRSSGISVGHFVVLFVARVLPLARHFANRVAALETTLVALAQHVLLEHDGSGSVSKAPLQKLATVGALYLNSVFVRQEMVCTHFGTGDWINDAFDVFPDRQSGLPGTLEREGLPTKKGMAMTVTSLIAAACWLHHYSLPANVEESAMDRNAKLRMIHCFFDDMFHNRRREEGEKTAGSTPDPLDKRSKISRRRFALLWQFVRVCDEAYSQNVDISFEKYISFKKFDPLYAVYVLGAENKFGDSPDLSLPSEEPKAPAKAIKSRNDDADQDAAKESVHQGSGRIRGRDNDKTNQQKAPSNNADAKGAGAARQHFSNPQRWNKGGRGRGGRWN